MFAYTLLRSNAPDYNTNATELLQLVIAAHINIVSIIIDLLSVTVSGCIIWSGPLGYDPSDFLSVDVEDRQLADAPFSDNHVLKRNATRSIQAGDVLTGRQSCKGSGYTVTVKGLALNSLSLT